MKVLCLSCLLCASFLAAQTAPQRVYAPYIMTRPTPDLARIAGESGIRTFTLAFIISSRDTNCHATWGGRTTLADESELAPAIESLRSRGGDVIVSFGGEAGKELALTCDSPTALQAQYQAVIDKYKISALDLDIEGTALKDSAANDRRNAALAAIQAANPAIQISYTLPVATDGLTKAGIDLLANAMAHGVRVSVVNVMTMDYGGAADPLAMGRHAISAVNGTIAQMLDNGIRARIGITPMIGLNDVKPEVFSLSDAQTVANWAQANPVVVRLSMWSVPRDAPCPAERTGTGSSCSGVAQELYDFTKILGAFH